MFTKIYFDEKPLFLADVKDPELESYLHHEDTVLIDEMSSPAINAMIHEMKQEKIHAGIFIHENLQELKEAFFRKFIMVPAAGGFVMNERNEVLMIRRKGKWDLPKGKLDPGETIETCALREVKEETGLKSVSIINPLVITYHTYDENGKHILKDSHWYRMSSHSNEKLIPQLNEQITDIEWVSKSKIPGYLVDSYPSIVDVFKAAEFL